MGTRLGSEQLNAWQQRLAKFAASGLSVTTFCRQEGITPARFYYWSRRVRDHAGAGESKWSGESAGVDRQVSEIADHIEVAIGEHVKIKVPTNDYGLIELVLAGLQSSAVVAKAAGAFEQIELSRSSVAPR